MAHSQGPESPASKLNKLMLKEKIMARYIEHPLIKPGTIEARTFQQVMAAGVLKKGNSMIVAPTALGKTIVAVLVAAERLRKFKGSKVLVLAPSKPLAIQHEERFREFLLASCTSITGNIKPEERVKRWDESQVITATPQTVESDVLSGRYNLMNVTGRVAPTPMYSLHQITSRMQRTPSYLD